MKLEGRKVLVNKSTKDLFEMLKKPEDYKHLMPESLVSFETIENGFKFGLKGMPEIALKISEMVEDKKVVLTSGNPSLDFALIGQMDAVSEEFFILCADPFPYSSTFIKMMVEKPLQSFIDNLTDKIEGL